MASSFDALFNQTQKTPPPAAADQTGDGGSSFDSLFTGAPKPSAKSQTEAPLPTSSFTSAPANTSSFDSIFKSDTVKNSPSISLSEEERRQSAPDNDSTSNVDEPWYSKTWDWLNRPLYDAHQWGQRTGAGTIERGVESGVEDLISGFTSPLSVALTVGTLGGDALANVGIQGLKAIGVNELAAPIVARGAKVLMDSGFTAQNLTGLMTQAPAFLDALKDGDFEGAARLGTNILAVTGLTGLGARKSFEDVQAIKNLRKGNVPTTRETLADVHATAGILDEQRAVAASEAHKFHDEIVNQLKEAGIEKDEIRQGAIRKYMTTGGDLDLLRDMHDTLAGTLKTKAITPEEALSVAFPEQMFDKNYVYRAVDAKTGEVIRNAGFHPEKPGSKLFFDSPTEAINNAAFTPTHKPTGTAPSDVQVFAIPRSEMKPTAKDAVIQGLTGKDVREAAAKRDTAARYPSHQVVVDDEGNPTGQVIPLRSDSTFSLTTNREPFEAAYSPAEKEKLLAQYKAAQNLSPEEVEIAKQLRTHYDSNFDKAFDNGLIREAIKNYHPQAWAKDEPGLMESLFNRIIKPSDNPAMNELRHQTDNGAFDTNITAAKHRAYRTEFNGEMAGEKFSTNDLAKHAADYGFKIDRAIAARNFIENLRSKMLKASDGRPLVAMSGSSRVVGEESGNPALLVNPASAKSIAISHDIIKDWAETPDPRTGLSKLDAEIQSGRVEKLPWAHEIKTDDGEITKVPAFAYNTDGYQTIDHHAMRDWSYVGQDTVGNNAILKSEMRVHPEAADYVRQVIGADKSYFRENPYLRTLMTVQREAKGALLSLSPFHAVQEGLRALMVGINPLSFKLADVANEPLLRQGIRNGLTLGHDYKAEDMFQEGNASHSKIIGKIPGVGKLNSAISEFIFDRMIPSFKARAFKSVYGRFLDRMPGASAAEVSRQAASYVNDAFGGQNWRELGFSATAQDATRALALAPDWLTSEIRSLWRVAGGMGKPAAAIARQDFARIGAYAFVTARVLNMLTTGKAHPEAPFGLVIPGKNGEDEKVYSLRTLPTDLIHVMTAPREFVMGRVNPLIVRPTIEGLTGRDSFGRKVTGPQQFSDFYHNFVPIGAQGLMKGGAPGGLSEGDQAAKALGTSVYRYKTEAEKLAQEKASDHMPSGAVSPESLAKHQRNIRLEDQLRNGEITSGQIRRLMTPREAEDVIRQSKMNGLQSRFARLPLSEKLDVFQLATPVEKDQLHSMLWKARVEYLKSHPPSQRADDAVWIKARKVFGDLN